jgi:hypothetical protein
MVPLEAPPLHPWQGHLWRPHFLSVSWHSASSLELRDRDYLLTSQKTAEASITAWKGQFQRGPQRLFSHVVSGPRLTHASLQTEIQLGPARLLLFLLLPLPRSLLPPSRLCFPPYSWVPLQSSGGGLKMGD